MRCEKAKIWIQKHFDRDLSLRRKKKLEEHLLKCPSCAEEFASLNSSINLLESMKFKEEGKALSAMAQAFSAETPKNRSLIKPFSYALGSLAVLFVVLFFLIINVPDVKDAHIKKGLQFLVSSQRADGAWDTDYFKKSVSSTAMAVVAFSETSERYNDPAYKRSMVKGVRFLMKSSQPSGLISGKEEASVSMFAHAYGMLALSKVYKKTGDKELRDVLERAVHLSTVTQNKRGGWKYQLMQMDDDIAVTTSELLALMEAKNAGIPVDEETITKGIQYIESCAQPGGGFGYLPEKNIATGFSVANAGVSVLLSNYNRLTPQEQNLIKQNTSYIQNTSMKKQYEDPYFFCGLFYYVAHTEYLREKTGSWTAQQREINKMLMAKQNKDGSWSNSVGSSYATAVATYMLKKS